MNQAEAELILLKAKRDARGMILGLSVTFVIFLIYCFAQVRDSAVDIMFDMSGMIGLAIVAILFQYARFKKIILEASK